MCADVLLLRIQDFLRNDDEIARAFADDTAVVVSDYIVAIPTIDLLHEYELISGLQLNIDKTIFIPLWPLASEHGLRNLIREICPRWRDIKIETEGKYLGRIIGPGSQDGGSSKAIWKFNQRIKQWIGSACGLAT